MIDLTAGLNYSLVLFEVAGFVVAAQRSHLLAGVRGKDGPAVAYVRYVADLANNQYYDRARSRTFYHSHLTRCLVLGLAHLQKPTFSLLKALPNGLLWLPREIVLLDHVVMQIVSQKLGAGAAPVAVVDAEERACRPRLVLPVLRFDDVEDDGDAVLIVVTHEALVCVGCVCAHDAVALVAALGGLVVRDYYPRARRQWQGRRLLLLLVHHAVRVHHSK